MPLRCGASPAVLLLIIACAVASAPRPGLATAPPHEGAWPADLVAAREAGLLAPAPRSLAVGKGERRPGALAPAAGAAPATGTWRVPVLLVSFTDEPPAHDAAGFQTLLFDTTQAHPDGSLAEYYERVSRGALHARGQVFGWYALPHERNFYAANAYGARRTGTPRNAAGLVLHAVAAADAEVDFSKFDRDGDGEVDVVMVAHAGLGAEFSPSNPTLLWSLSSGLASGWSGAQPYVTNDPVPGGYGQTVRVNRFAIVPELSGVVFGARSEIGVYCHEFGHALGWPDLYDARVLGGASNLGPANWCLMSTGLYGGASLSPERPTRPCAWALSDMGWATVENLTRSGVVSFEPADVANRVYRLWWEGQTSSEYFLAENRRRRGQDADLPGEGLLIYHVEADIIAASRAANRVNSGFVPGLRLEEADGMYHLLSSINRADAGDPFPGASGATTVSDATQPSLRTYDARYSNVSLADIRTAGDRVEAWVQLEPTGWSEPQIEPIPGVPRLGEGRAFALGDSKLRLIYQNDADLGRVYAMEQHASTFWGAPLLVSGSTVSSDATWSAGSGPLTALWTDRRHGTPTIYYRPWTPTPGAEERAVHGPSAFASRPSGAWDATGQLHAIWIDARLGAPLLFHKHIQPGAAADSGERLVAPHEPGQEVLEYSMDAGAPGNLYLAFTLRTWEGDEVYWTRFTAASGWTTPQRISGLDGFPSGSPEVRVQRDGKVRVVWRDLGTTRNNVRTVVFDPYTNDFVPTTDPLYVTPLSLAAVRFASGPANQDLFVARASEAPWDRILAAHRHGDGAWDAGLGSVSVGMDAGNHRLGAFVEDDGTAVLAWAGPVESAGQVVVRRRRVEPASLVDVPAAPRPDPEAVPVHAFPNPAHRAGVRFAVAPGRGGHVAIYAPTGRRVALLDAAAGSAAWDGRDAAGRLLPPGVYLYRLEEEGRASRAGKLVWIP
jgi:immune inhibitor A